jgi:hypothetical protein
MSHALKCQAEIQHDVVREIIDMDSGDDFVDAGEYGVLRFVPYTVRNNMRTNKSIRQGFANLCLHFAACIKGDGILRLPVPIELKILGALRAANEWPPTSRNFLERGGTVYTVGSMIFNYAMEQDQFSGDRQHWDIFHEQISKLPECRNDHEYGFVSAMCGCTNDFTGLPMERLYEF